MNLPFITCFIICVIPNLLSGQETTEDENQEIERRVTPEINPSISIGLLLSNGETKFYNYGQYNEQTNQQADSFTLYEIGSVTKTFTTTLLSNYLKDSLDTSISEVFPEVNNANLDQITLFDVRNHIAGVPRLSDQLSPKDWSDPFNGYSDSLLNVELQYLNPDTSQVWSYSNFGYGILGRALEKKTTQ